MSRDRWELCRETRHRRPLDKTPGKSPFSFTAPSDTDGICTKLWIGPSCDNAVTSVEGWKSHPLAAAGEGLLIVEERREGVTDPHLRWCGRGGGGPPPPRRVGCKRLPPFPPGLG